MTAIIDGYLNSSKEDQDKYHIRCAVITVINEQLKKASLTDLQKLDAALRSNVNVVDFIVQRC